MLQNTQQPVMSEDEYYDQQHELLHLLHEAEVEIENAHLERSF